MSFTVPNIIPFTLPAIPPPSVLSATLTGLVPPVPDAAFLNKVLDISSTDFVQDRWFVYQSVV